MATKHTLQTLDSYSIADQEKVVYLQRIVDLLDQPDATTGMFAAISEPPHTHSQWCFFFA